MSTSHIFGRVARDGIRGMVLANPVEDVMIKINSADCDVIIATYRGRWRPYPLHQVYVQAPSCWKFHDQLPWHPLQMNPRGLKGVLFKPRVNPSILRQVLGRISQAGLYWKRMVYKNIVQYISPGRHALDQALLPSETDGNL